jgi:hypothetical protein
VLSIITSVFADIIRAEDPRRIEWLWARMWCSYHFLASGAASDVSSTTIEVHGGR